MQYFNRLLEGQHRSFMLFGPRGTGKSTWVQKMVDAKLKLNLLDSKDLFKYSANPSLLFENAKHLKEGDWVLIDEAQKIPQLLNEVHRLIEDKRLLFAITGSSARKLKKADVNLLGGRATRLDFFPLCFKELQTENFLTHALNFGTLPLTILDSNHAQDILFSYVATYLKEEVAAEALTKDLVPYSRFLETAAKHHAQQLNISAIASESSLKRNTVESYFQILEDTLIGYRLPALKLGMREKETAHPKFYFFDSGVARTAAGWIMEELPNSWLGYSFETLVLNEIRTYNSYRKKHKNIFHYSVHGSFDIDFIVECKKKILQSPATYLGIEVKLSPIWNEKWGTNLLRLNDESPKKMQRIIGVYTGKKKLEFGKLTVYPWMEFVNSLWDGEFF